MEKGWTIGIGEWPLEKLGPLDNLVLGGRDITHSFLVLIDPEVTVTEQIHGRPYNHKKGVDRPYTPLTLNQIFNVMSHPPDAPVKTNNNNRLRVFHTDGGTPELFKKKGTVITPMLSGTEETMQELWRDCLVRASQINAADCDYIAIGLTPTRCGQNCHAVTSDLLNSIGVETADFDATHASQFYRPGVTRNIIHAITDAAVFLNDLGHTVEEQLQRINMVSHQKQFTKTFYRT